MKIKRKRYRQIEDGEQEIEVTHSAIVPDWLAPITCHACGFEFDHREAALALKLATLEVIFIRQSCHSRIIV